jgi:hypothetical protein
MTWPDTTMTAMLTLTGLAVALTGAVLAATRRGAPDRS